MLDNRIPPPVLTLATGIAMWFAAAPGPVPAWRNGAALVIFLVALGIGLLAVRAFRSSRTTIDPVRIDEASALVTSGIYRLSRNPMYVAVVLVLVAWAVRLGGVWVWAGPVGISLWIDRFQIRPEERVLASLFGDAFVRYCGEVRRWL